MQEQRSHTESAYYKLRGELTAQHAVKTDDKITHKADQIRIHSRRKVCQRNTQRQDYNFNSSAARSDLSRASNHLRATVSPPFCTENLIYHHPTPWNSLSMHFLSFI